MITLLGGPEDGDLLWLAAALRRRGEQADVVLPEEIVADATLTCRLDRTGVSSTLRLRDGRAIGEHEPSLVINRLTKLPVRHTASAVDGAYLAEEWRAALVAWLRTLPCPVLNPPRAASLGGPVLSIPAWRAVARAHGLGCRPWTSGDTSAVTDPIDLVVVGDTCLDPSGTAPDVLPDRLRRMSQFVGAPLLGARFDRADHWCFVGATIFPPLAEGGQPLLDAVVRLSRTPQRIA